MKFLINILITGVAAFFLQKILPGVHISDLWTAIVFALVLALLDAIVKPILSILGAPITFITLGLFSLVINGIIILLATYFIDSMKVDDLLWAILFSIALSIVQSIAKTIFNND